MRYSPELSKEYTRARETYDETDRAIFHALESAGGVQGKTVLDLGCGDGKHAQMIHDLGAEQVVGVDVNEKMVGQARSRMEGVPGLSFLVADGTHLPLADGSVDVIFSNYVAHYFPDSTALFLELSRVLKPNGRFVGTFNITDIDSGFERLRNTPMPIRLGGTTSKVVVQNLIKTREEIDHALEEASLRVLVAQELDHPNAVIDDTFADKAHVHKHAMLFVLQKQELPGVE